MAIRYAGFVQTIAAAPLAAAPHAWNICGPQPSMQVPPGTPGRN